MKKNYLAYVKAVGNWNGSVTGGAYIIMDGNDTFKISSKAQVNTIAYKMEFLTVVSAACSVPDGSSVTILTNNKMLMSLNYLNEVKAGAKFPKLKALYLERKEKLGSIKVVWRKKQDDVMFNSVADMAEQVFEELCAKNNIKLENH